LKLVLGAAVLGVVVVCATQPALARTETLLSSFVGEPGDGINPYAGLVMDTNGNLYGTTRSGGAHTFRIVFKLTPAGSETVLYNFGSQTGDGQYPEADLIMDKKNNLYGTTYRGGANGYGTVFKLTPAGKETVLYASEAIPTEATRLA